MFEAQQIVFAGGGTAGHLFPGINVARALATKYPHLKITFAGTGKPFERHTLVQAGFAYLTLPAQPFPTRARDALRFVTDNITGYYSASWFLRHHDVALVVGLGGYASVPMCRAAARSDVPYVLMEQNVTPGRATRYLCSRAAAVCTSFVDTAKLLRRAARAEHTGNPVDARLSLALPVDESRSSPKRVRRLLVLGGSNGSQSLNEQAPRALYKSRVSIDGWQIVHQTGPRDVSATRALYQKLGLKAYVSPFLGDLPPLLLNSDLAISRAGGTTLAELAASGVPAVLVPYPAATDDHQRKNAEAFVARRAARLVDPREIKGRLDDALALHVNELVTSPSLRVRMGIAMQQFARPQATENVVGVIESVVDPVSADLAICA